MVSRLGDADTELAMKRIPFAVFSFVILCVFALPLTAQEDPAPAAPTAEEIKTKQAELAAKFDSYVDEYPNLKEVKDQLKNSPTAYAVHLKNCKEPTLAPPMKLRPTDFIVRMIVLDVPAKKSTIIRLNKTWGGVELIGKTLDATKIYEGQKKGDYKLSDIIVVRKQDFQAVEDLVNKLDFFKMDTAGAEVPIDAPSVMIEVVTDKDHKIVERYLNDQKQDDFYLLARKLGKLSKLDLGKLTKD